MKLFKKGGYLSEEYESWLIMTCKSLRVVQVKLNKLSVWKLAAI